MLYYAANTTSGPPPSNFDAAVPMLKILLRVNETQGNPVKNLAISNVNFRDAAPTYAQPSPSGSRSVCHTCATASFALFPLWCTAVFVAFADVESSGSSVFHQQSGCEMTEGVEPGGADERGRWRRCRYMDPHGVPSGGDWALERLGALFFEGTTGLSVDSCQFERLDGNGIMLSGFHRAAAITNSHFAWTGGTLTCACLAF